MTQNTCTIWVCQSCMLHHANGECGDCVEDLRHHDREPMWLYSPQDVTMGMLVTEHSCKSSDELPHWWECDCEIKNFSWSICDGCGSTLGGERHAMTLWLSDND